MTRPMQTIRSNVSFPNHPYLITTMSLLVVESSLPCRSLSVSGELTKISAEPAYRKAQTKVVSDQRNISVTESVWDGEIGRWKNDDSQHANFSFLLRKWAANLGLKNTKTPPSFSLSKTKHTLSDILGAMSFILLLEKTNSAFNSVDQWVTFLHVLRWKTKSWNMISCLNCKTIVYMKSTVSHSKATT